MRTDERLTEVVIDAEEMTSRGAAHAVLARKLALPDYYGRNLDALHDSLTEIGTPVHLILRHSERMEEMLGSYGTLLMRVLEEAAEENPNLWVTFSGEESM